MIASTDSPRTDFAPARGFLDVGIAVLAFVLVCAGLNALLPFPEIDVVSPKLRYFRQHQDDFDTVFIGSSRIRHQISPAIFDETMREAGLPTRTFNFGVNAMVPPESIYVLERLLANKPRHLRWVFIELDELYTKRVPEMENTHRSLYWRDWKRTWLVIRAILDAGPEENGFALLRRTADLLLPGLGKSEARDLLFFHVELFAKNSTNIGRKTDLSRWISQFWKRKALSQEVASGAGYVPLNNKMSAAQAAVYETELESAMTHGGFRFLSASTERAYRQLAEEVKKAGAIPIFLVPPLSMQVELGFRPEPGIAGTVLSFNNARAYQQLYRNEMRIDGGHLNSAAAEEFTRLVAEEFSRLRRENRIQ